jgi:cation transport ATPase
VPDAIREDASSRRRTKGATLIVVGLVVCIIPYFVAIGLPIYLVGADRVLKSNQATKNKAMVLAVSFAILVSYYVWLLMVIRPRSPLTIREFFPCRYPPGSPSPRRRVRPRPCLW